MIFISFLHGIRMDVDWTLKWTIIFVLLGSMDGCKDGASLISPY